MVQHSDLDATFAALSDSTRRGILEHLTRGAATVSELAESFEMTLTGIKKHLALLEAAGMVVSEKRGRVRFCRLGTNPLRQELDWMLGYHREVEARLDRLEAFLENDDPNRTEKDR
ncbi:ArsR family transcriptional regulator [Rhodococcus sp. AG1013]|uniref:ArsR/SmtB family transcription factor n=1 Tax=Rhodococcus sp. AG1013 TaxID=2183996 RepID=UPI000E0A61E4|nr:metalloregulator ArsR/SmtB family transcription factor [Rhodococcus sp. AG1013]RDI35855.1 ArsR family transcriptional regulator [Rhodococcus sp. AG1013]